MTVKRITAAAPAIVNGRPTNKWNGVIEHVTPETNYSPKIVEKVWTCEHTHNSYSEGKRCARETGFRTLGPKS